MPHPVFAASKTALITGAASGIGLAISKRCSTYGMNVALVDNNISGLPMARASLEHPDEAEFYQCDVSREEEWEGLREKVMGKFGRVDLLVLNAGIGPKSDWEGEVGGFKKIMDVNFFGVVNGIAAFLPVLKKIDAPTAVVVTGSKQGITNPPGNPAYNASKSAIKTITEHLSFDMRNTQTSVHLLIPGWTFTGLSGGQPGTTKPKPDGAWSADQVAEFLEQKMDEKQFYVVCPDNDVSEELDRKRILWSCRDLVEGRPPLTRWREDWKEKASEGVADIEV